MNDPQQTVTVATRRRLLACAIVLVLLVSLSLVWVLSPLRELVDLRSLMSMLRAFSGNPAAPWLILAGFVVGGLVALPVTFMVVLAVATFGPVAGFLYGLGGATLSGTVSFAIGRTLGHRHVAQLTGSRLHGISMKLRSGGVTAIAAVRMMPVTHFAVVSLVAGVSHVRLRDFILGTVIGMAPGVGAIALVGRQVVATAHEPGLEQFAWLMVVSLAILALLIGCRRLARRG